VLKWEKHGSRPGWAKGLQDPTSTEKNLGTVAHNYHPSYSEKLKIRDHGSGQMVRLGKKRDPISKITRAKRAGLVAQAGLEAWSSAKSGQNVGILSNMCLLEVGIKYMATRGLPHK
jgi:hypothetical protein